MRKDLWEGNKEEGIFFSVCELILPSLGKSLRSIARYSPGEEEGRMFGEDHVVFKGNGGGISRHSQSVYGEEGEQFIFSCLWAAPHY